MMKNLYLATSGISEFWDLSADKILLLGPWCLAEEKNVDLLKGKDCTVIPSPWKPAHKLKEAADYCYGTYKHVLPQLADNLNRIHEVSYPVKYWQVLLGPWLLHLVEVFYDRYRRIENALSLFPNIFTHTVIPDKCNQAASDMYEFVLRACEDDYYNLKLFSLVAHELCPDNTMQTDYLSEHKTFSLTNSWQGKLLNKMNKAAGSSGSSSIILTDMYHLSLLDMLALKWKAGKGTVSFMGFESPSDFVEGVKISDELRETIEMKGSHDRFQSLLYKIIPHEIPVCYMERYMDIRDFINNNYTINSVKAVGSAVGWYFNEPFKFFSAEAAANGAETVEFQYGGGYGMLLSIQEETLALEKDIFYTWGLVKEHENKVLPLPSSHLSKISDTHLPKTQSIIFVGMGMYLYTYRFHSLAQTDDMLKYFEDKWKFYRTLPNEIKKNILYRPYSEIGWNEMERMKKKCPDMRFILKGKLIGWMMNAKLVVIDHPQTAFLEALAINVPSIFYWDHNVFLMRPEAETYYEMLRKAGIVYKTPEDAAHKLREVFDDPLGWWKSQEIQDARNIFIKRFGYSRKDWLKIWAEELKKIKGCCLRNNGIA